MRGLTFPRKCMQHEWNVLRNGMTTDRKSNQMRERVDIFKTMYATCMGGVAK